MLELSFKKKNGKMNQKKKKNELETLESWLKNQHAAKRVYLWRKTEIEDNTSILKYPLIEKL